MSFNLNDLEDALGNDIVDINRGGIFSIDHVVFDSREVTDRTLFVAKKGDRNDGHDFIESVLRANDSALVLAERLPAGLGSQKRIILVKDTLKAFENLAIFSRNRIKGTVLGITGSIGKTSTKDIVSRTLSCYGKIHCSQLSFNNYIGTLTTLANSPADVDYLVCEMGVGDIGEMGKLVDLVRPDIAIVMNIKPSHISYFSSEENIALEKSQIVRDGAKLAVLNMDDSWYEFMYSRASAKAGKIITFGRGSKADICLKKHEVVGNGAKVVYQLGEEKYSCDFENIDYNIAYNSMAALAVVKYLELPWEKALEAISSQETPRGRNNVEYASYESGGRTINLSIINGSYNAVIPDAFISGLEFMKNIFAQGKTARKVCIWGDMLETGSKANEFHQSLGERLIEAKVDILLTVGDNMKKLGESLGGTDITHIHFASIGELISSVKNILADRDLVFVKSSKGMKTYEVLNFLVKEKMKLFL
ncbi:MAG: UDP-N-acetylmuramoyl-tripeptide--D-alanyl-D-alanine ligase [Rickettsiales bacterium]|jgi:UDP-N-acetylmuramoyl-tripeptide--D-alanyl-D-alanine ligase|nr:UDP-N-acetylmuramoyl-tripeptide--D-alanyl-D-alanine ligase [Rickettsiales bacterium]